MKYREYVQHRGSRNRVLRSERGRRRWREIIIFLAGAGMLAAPAVLYVGMRHERMRMERATEAMQREIRDLREENHRLRVRRAQLESLSRIEEAARTELGLSEPGEDRVTLVFTDTPAAMQVRHVPQPLPETGGTEETSALP